MNNRPRLLLNSRRRQINGEQLPLPNTMRTAPTYMCPICSSPCIKRPISLENIRTIKFRFLCLDCNYTSRHTFTFLLRNRPKPSRENRSENERGDQGKQQAEQKQRQEQQCQTTGEVSSTRARNAGDGIVNYLPFSIQRLLDINSPLSAPPSSSENHAATSPSSSENHAVTSSSSSESRTVVQPSFSQDRAVAQPSSSQDRAVAPSNRDFDSAAMDPVMKLRLPLKKRQVYTNPDAYFQPSKVLVVADNVPLDLTPSRLPQHPALDPFRIVHNRADMDVPYICEKCGLIFCDAILYTRHSRFHNSKNPLMCNECGLVVSNKNAFLSHICEH
ncbi:Zinc finger C2H2-type [Cinara cedri]|uniref:Zinc finger C2H2-type n=1 Tax=Cinara cedri TaxID=506608 RepID=A0A5E4NM52_9HEMI|nr:Zinc finger C2H2-type [Cinara cedri]